jgi:hypothetical protein
MTPMLAVRAVAGNAIVAATPAIVDLLGVLGYAQLCGFDRLAADSRLAPTLAGRADMARMAAVELAHYETLDARLRELGADPAHAMAPFVEPLERYHALTQPSSWFEALVKAYIGGGLADDFYLQVARYVDEPTRQLIETVLADEGQGEFAIREVQAAVEADTALGARLSLWGRRLVGEAISQAQHVLAGRDPLMRLLVESGDLAGLAGMIGHLTERNAERMARLGLKS